jgi:hypothetical protein
MTAVANFERKPSETLVVGKGFKLSDVDADSTPGYTGGKSDGQALLQRNSVEPKESS